MIPTLPALDRHSLLETQVHPLAMILMLTLQHQSGALYRILWGSITTVISAVQF